MPQLQKFLEALSLLPEVARVRQQAMKVWGNHVPVQLDFALVGGQIAKHFLTYTDDQRTYIRGVLSYGLNSVSCRLRNLVLCPLLSTLFERSRRMGPAHEQAVLQHLHVAAEGDLTLSGTMRASITHRSDAHIASHSHADNRRATHTALRRPYPPPAEPRASYVHDSPDEEHPEPTKRRP